METRQNLSERLKKLRIERNLSKTQLANAIEISARTITNRELGSKNMRMKHILRLTRFFCVSVDYLLGLTD